MAFLGFPAPEQERLSACSGGAHRFQVMKGWKTGGCRFTALRCDACGQTSQQHICDLPEHRLVRTALPLGGEIKFG